MHIHAAYINIGPLFDQTKLSVTNGSAAFRSGGWVRKNRDATVSRNKNCFRGQGASPNERLEDGSRPVDSP
jgi:hypothetical protein